MPIDYEKEAADYDRTRGGDERARAAADAVLTLLQHRSGRLADVGGGTGIVSQHLAQAGFDVTVVDQSKAMLDLAEKRLPGHCIQAPADAIPVPDASFDVITCVWLLHLVPDSEPIIREAGRLLRPGGMFITTVDKAAAQGARPRAHAQDGRDLVTTRARANGLSPTAETTFVGVGQDGNPQYTLLALTRDTSEPQPLQSGSHVLDR